jgi:ABC-type transporter Mla maintaining outer membrane lipid asymmetry permease subunit MlaE
MIGCYKGFNAENGTASGTSCNSAVVTASLFLSLTCYVQLTDYFKMEQEATTILPQILMKKYLL